MRRLGLHANRNEIGDSRLPGYYRPAISRMLTICLGYSKPQRSKGAYRAT